MRRTMLLVMCGLTCVSLGRASAPPSVRPSTFVDHDYGFSINAPQFELAKTGATVSRVFLFAPPEDGFASNVNVMIQETAIARAEYRKISLKQYETLGYKVNAEENRKVDGKDTLFLDAEGEQQGKEMRFLSLAVFDTKRVILTTCTALKSNFAKYEPALRASLNSFKLVP
jgi:hypothetical protein